MKATEIKQMVAEEHEKEQAEFMAEQELTRPFREIEYLCCRGRIPSPIGWRKKCPECGGQLTRRQVSAVHQGRIYTIYECPHCDYIYVKT